MSFNKGTNVTKRVNQASKDREFSLSIDDVYKIGNVYHFFSRKNGFTSYLSTTADIPPSDSNNFSIVKLEYQNRIIDLPGNTEKGFLKDGTYYTLILVYKNVDSFAPEDGSKLGLNFRNAVGVPGKAWVIVEWDVNNLKFIVKNIKRHEGSVDGDHSLIYTENTPDGIPRFYICGRVRRSNEFDWGTAPDAPDGSNKSISPNDGSYYPLSNDPRREENARTISFANDTWDDRRGIKFYESTSINGPFEDAAQRGVSSPGSNNTTYLKRYADPRQIYTNYDTSQIKTDVYGITAFNYKNYNFYLSTIYFKDEKRYSVLRKDRVTGDGVMAPQVIFTKNNEDFYVVKDYPEGVNDPLVIEGKSLVSDADFQRVWYTPAPSNYYKNATTQEELFRDPNELENLLPDARTFAGPPELGQIYVHTIWESADGNYWYIYINDAARPHYHALFDGKWYITGQNGTVTYGGSNGNKDIVGSITFRPTNIQDKYKWEHLTQFLSKAKEPVGKKVGTDYIFYDVNTPITMNVGQGNQTKTVKEWLETIDANKWPFYKWVKHSLNYSRDGSYGLNKAGKNYIVKIRKESFAYFSKLSSASSGTITSKLISITSDTRFISINSNGNITVQIKNSSNNILQTATLNTDSIDNRIELIQGLPSQIKVTFIINSGKLYSFKFFKLLSDSQITGGTETVVNGYKYHTFTGNGTLNVTASSPKSVEVLLVGGGGAGGGKLDLNFRGGGGGGGGVIQQTLNLTTNNYTINVGNGGSGQNTDGIGNTGQNTTAFSLTALGGGGGGVNNLNGLNGGSGGGGLVGGQSSSSQGNNGGSNPLATAAGPGGGGATQVGSNPIDATNVGGNGGEGINVWGTVYGSGGGGASSAIAATAGLGGTNAGKGRGNGTSSTAGIVNTGGGGGGNRLANGSNGGSGIVIIRYPI